MYRMMLASLLALLVPSMALATVNSSGEAPFSPKNGLDLSHSFEGQRQAIVKALADGETYSEIAPEDRLAVQESLDRISGLLGGVHHVDQLQPEAKVRVFNEQERVNTLLTHAHKESRMVCTREVATGSNMRTNTCMTVAQRRKHREAAVQFFQFNPRAQSRPTEN